MKKIPKSIKFIGRKCFNLRDRLLARYYHKMIKKNPQKHASIESKRQKQFTVRPVNIKTPKFFSEKMYWLKYFMYNDSPLVAQCYNKYEVREYVKSKGLSHILNELYGVWDSIEEIDWASLPEEYVMKISNGYAGHVFKRKNTNLNIASAKKILTDTKRKYSYFFSLTGDIFAGNTKQHIICERMLHSNLGYTAPEDFKFYCFNGKPLFIDYMFNREGGSSFNEFFVDINLNDRNELEGNAIAGTFEAPKCMGEMLEIAKILSEDFPFVRVDLYVENERPIFGELTFTPFHKQTKESEYELGALLDISNLEFYEDVLAHNTFNKM